MSDVVDSVNRILQDLRTIEVSPFYKDYQNFSKLYDTLIREGVTRRRESQLKTIQEQNKHNFVYNTNTQ